MDALTPESESARLHALLECDVLDTAPEPAFDELTWLASRLCETPVSLISLIDEHRQWFKSRLGLDRSETPREMAFCAHAIQQSDDVMIVPDAALDPQFAENPLVVGEPHIRFYAGAPLRTSDGYAMGTLCVIDTRPRRLSGGQLDMLRALARQAAGQLDLRRTLSQLSEARRAAEDANIAKSMYLANISHEIRTPMTAIIGHSEILSDAARDLSKLDESIHTIQRSGRHLLDLINSVIDMSRIESGSFPIELEQCSLLEIIGDVAALAREQAEKKGLALVVEGDGSLPVRLATDAVRLRQILINLISNAIKFSKRGEVRLAVGACEDPGRGGADLVFTVTDEGPGMTPDQVHGLFKPFSRCDDLRNAPFEGAGLGLAISRELARVLGGDIEVDTEPGRGSAFTVSICSGADPDGPRLEGPLEERLREQSKSSRRDDESASPPSLAGSRILLVEDGLDNQRLIRTHLVKAGADVEIAANGAEALLRLSTDAGAAGAPAESTRFDLILMDMQMPVMNGYEATRTIGERGGRMPVLALTARALADDRRACLDAGCDDYLTKPILRDDLINACHRAIHEPIVRAA